MGFGIALSGVDAAQSDLDVISNNIANASTTGFKESTANFSELFSVSQTGVSGTEIGNGVALQQVEQQFSQGDIDTTGNNLDLALNGNGFFVVSADGATQYTRAGAFQTNADGFVVNSAGQNLQVYAPTQNGGFNTTTTTNLQLATGDNAPEATTSAQMIFNLPSGSSQPADTPFSPTDPSSYNQSTSLTVYDSLGAAHTASMYFVQTATPGKWDAYEYIDGNQVNANADPVVLTYNASGTLTAATNADGTPAASLASVSFGSYTPANTGANAIAMTFDMSKTTQYGGTFGVTSVTQNGYTTGQLSGVSVSSTGVVEANYTNGQSTSLGQVAIANFPDPQGLQQTGNTNWVETFGSGAPLYTQAGNSGVGTIQSGAIEDSNVDITAQLVDMITAQRAFQANTEMISTQDQITQSIINIPQQG
jgi:flagellar hook protein FlgE